MPTVKTGSKRNTKSRLTSDEAAEKNLALAAEFYDFVIANPEAVKGVPKKAKIVFMNGSKRLNDYNRGLGRRICKEEKKPVFTAKRLGRSKWDIAPLAGCTRS